MVLTALEDAINWVLRDAEPLPHHMAAGVGCKSKPSAVPTATQNGSEPSAVTTPPPTPCSSHGPSMYFLQSHPIFLLGCRRIWKAVKPNVSCKPLCQQHVNVLGMLGMLPAPLICLFSSERRQGCWKSSSLESLWPGRNSSNNRQLNVCLKFSST